MSIVNQWDIPAHFQPAIELAVLELRNDGYEFENVKFGSPSILNPALIRFELTAKPYDIFRLGVKVGKYLNLNH